MSNLMASLEVPSAPSSRRGRGRLLFAGQKRRLIRKALTTLLALQRSDEREDARGVQQGYNPNLFRGNLNSLEDRAIKRIIEQCGNCLKARE